MLRSLFSGISGLRSHQTMLDVTGNNIANVNTTGFKSSQTQFQDTLSQVLQNAGAGQGGTGGTNPAQVGLGVRVAGITTSFAQGSTQLTGRSTDMMIQGDGFFVVRRGAESFYTRSGAFDFDGSGRMVLPGEGAIVQGWAAVDGVVDTNGPLVDLTIPAGALIPASATTSSRFTGNLDAAAEDGTTLRRVVTVYDRLGTPRELELAFTKSAAGWSVAASDGAATVGSTPLTFDAGGNLTAPTSLTVGGVAVDISSLTGFAGIESVKADGQDGRAAGTLQSFSVGADGSITGVFSNGEKQVLGRVATASFTNPAGLAKTGGSMFATTANSGDPEVGAAGTGGRGSLAAGALEMSNVDLSSEFTNLIVAQRGFQASSRIITTSDEVLQELVNLKR